MNKNKNYDVADKAASTEKKIYKEVRKLKVFRADTTDEVIDMVNDFVERKDAKILNYTIDTKEMRKECILFYSKLIVVKN